MTFKPTCLASCSKLFATRNKLYLQIAQLEITLWGALLLQKWSLRESKNAYVQRSLEDVSQAKVNLWDTMKVFRIGTDGRKVPQYMQILPQFTDTQGEPYATSHEAAEGMLAHFAKAEGGFLVTPDTLITQVLEETKLRLETVHYGFVSDLPSYRKWKLL